MSNKFLKCHELPIVMLLNDWTSQNFADFVEANGRSIALAFAMMIEEKDMDEGLSLLMDAIKAQALDMAPKVRRESETPVVEVSATEFLATHFRPEKQNG